MPAGQGMYVVCARMQANLQTGAATAVAHYCSVGTERLHDSEYVKLRYAHFQAYSLRSRCSQDK